MGDALVAYEAADGIEDAREGLAAHLAKRAPAFKGR